ncbi:dihydrofolate reductase [Microlunatus elymi]|uniref:Dihydrofolate reductase n=1 Tax=Microlunatus elymi TaxID=2596828 RepID=A0A516PUA5_9ACTN|nr:dihydrofolate reductase family protein [Microlunatus elymi]QDP94710.1 dihydrofolate reductase [Microlunatus elymi]
MATQYYTATSIDGFIADAENSLDWLFQFDEGDESGYPEFIEKVGAIAMGATTYEWILAHHVNADAARPQPWPYRQPCWILTHRELPAVDGADLHFAAGDVVPIHAAMTEAAAGENIWLVGGGELVGQFHDHGLLDEVILSVAPVFLGSGAPLLPRKISTPPLELAGTRVVGGVFAELRYRVPRG